MFSKNRNSGKAFNTSWTFEQNDLQISCKPIQSVQSLSRVQLLWPHGLQHARLACSSLTPGASSNSCPKSPWCHPPISSSILPFSCLQPFPALASFPMCQFFASEKAMATHSSILAWRIPGMGEPGELPSIGSHRVGHDWSDLAAAAAATESLCYISKTNTTLLISYSSI